MSIDLTSALATAEETARRAGSLLRDALTRPRPVTQKGINDVVTETDKQSEALIVGTLLDAFPDHHFVGEEGGGRGAPVETADYRWHIDPLDGTRNFAYGHPHFSISIGLADKTGEPILGVVYDPVRDELFKAIRGSGATLNGRTIRVTQTPDLFESILVTGYPPDRWTNADNNMEESTAILTRARALRCSGSAALDLSYVAAGRYDGYWERSLNSWDITAGLLLVTEAGGRISNYRGRMDGVYQGQQVAASNGLIHERLLLVLVLGRDAPRPDQK